MGDCPLNRFDSWLRQQYNPDTNSYGTLSLPLPASEFKKWILTWRERSDHRAKFVGLKSEIDYYQSGQWKGQHNDGQGPYRPSTSSSSRRTSTGGTPTGR